jgi:hypothetical protein
VLASTGIAAGGLVAKVEPRLRGVPAGAGCPDLDAGAGGSLPATAGDGKLVGGSGHGSVGVQAR